MDKNTLTLIEMLARGYREALEQVELMALARETAETTACQYAYRAGRAEQETESIQQQLAKSTATPDPKPKPYLTRANQRGILNTQPNDPDAFREWVINIYMFSCERKARKTVKRIEAEFKHPSQPIPGYEDFDHSYGIVPFAAKSAAIHMIIARHVISSAKPNHE